MSKNKDNLNDKLTIFIYIIIGCVMLSYLYTNMRIAFYIATIILIIIGFFQYKDKEFIEKITRIIKK